MSTSTRHPDALIRTLEQQLNVLTREQAHAGGVTRHALQYRLRTGGSWRRLLPGVYIAATGTSTINQQEMAALLYAGQGSMITGLAALRHYSIRGPATEVTDVLIPASRRRSDTSFVRVHRTSRMPARVSQLGPLRYAPPARAVADTVRGLDNLREVRAVVADAVQRGSCRVQDLRIELAVGPNAGSALFREALADVAEGIRSAAEGDLKHVLARSGLPMPLFNSTIFAGDLFIARPDAWWPELGVAVEVDSVEWHLSPDDHARTLARGRRMAKYQINVLRFTPRQIRKEPAVVVADIRAALEGARSRPPLNLRTIPA
jgi:hypothetical protein